MSKMPAKKKSCFQITSVTQAQVAASSITDDTESLDDPDESRTEDVSSEIFDVSRADYDPEVCDISSSEETLNNVSETEVTTSVMKSHISQDVHISSVSGPPNGGVAYRNSGAPHANAHAVGGNMQATTHAVSTQQSTTAAASQSYSTPQPPPAASTSTTTSCSSRFRVIKLDHGTGEPFKRGRWMCTEFYDKESESSSTSRTVDSNKHVVTLDHNVDRDTSGSVATHSESASESGYVSAAPSELQAQSYGISHQAFGGASQSLAAPGHNGVPTSMHMQKSPGMPPSNHPQQFPYSTQQQHHPPTHNLPSVMPTPQPDYRPQQPTTVAPQPSGPTTSTTTHTLSVASLPVGGPLSQGPSPVMTPAGVPVHMLGLVTHVGDSAMPAGGSLSSGQPQSAQGLSHQQSAGGAGAAAVGILLQGGGVVHPQQPAQLSGQAGATAMIPGILSGNTGGPQSMPSQALTGGVSIQSQPQTSRSGAPQSEETRRKSDALPQPTGMPGKDTGKSVIPEGLTLGAPVVNSLFGIPITIDGDEDRNPSTAFYQAFPTSKLRELKPLGDSASGASVVAIDNKIEQAMDLVKSHLMYAVREEVEVLKEQIKELYERNSVLERENAVLKSLANNDQLSQLSTQLTVPPGSTSPPQQQQQPYQPQQHPSTSAEPAAPPCQPHNLSSA